MSNPYRGVACGAALKAGRILLQHFKRGVTAREKGVRNYVTQADLDSENAIKRSILKAFPDHEILAEESDLSGNPLSRYRWIIDPLDGTHSYIHGFHYFCVSIALEKDREIIYGLVYAPFYNEFFEAQKGHGATLNGKRIHVSKCQHVEDALFATGIPYNRAKLKQDNLKHFYRIGKRCLCLRRCGSAALDMAYVAMGRFDGYWEFGLNPWDVAAGALLLTEAGGKICNIGHRDYSIYRKHVIAAGPVMFSKLKRLIDHTA